MSKISDKSDKFLLHYSNFFRASTFYRDTQKYVKLLEFKTRGLAHRCAFWGYNI